MTTHLHASNNIV